MKKRYILLCFAALSVFFCSLELPAQGKILHIQFHTGESRDIALRTVSKVTFSEGDVWLLYTDETTERIGIMAIKELSFAAFTGIHELSPDGESVLLYPNPATDHLILKHIPEGENLIEIYSLTGGPVMKVRSQGGTQTIDISSLNQGLYILKLNGQVLKFTKL